MRMIVISVTNYWAPLITAFTKLLEECELISTTIGQNVGTVASYVIHGLLHQCLLFLDIKFKLFNILKLLHESRKRTYYIL